MDKNDKDYDSQIAAFEPLRIDKLVCKDCIHRFEKPQLVTKCTVYETKPPRVIYGGPCKDYIKE